MSENRHQKKDAKIWLAAGACLAIISLMVFCFPKTAICVSPNDSEAEAVLQAARNFLDAEVRRDYPAVYACFAPSSSYAVTHSYEEYLAEARSVQDMIVKYHIVEVTYIKNKEDQQTSSTVDKIAQVEVDVTFLHTGTRQQSEINIGFIFLKEGGKWYKS